MPSEDVADGASVASLGALAAGGGVPASGLAPDGDVDGGVVGDVLPGAGAVGGGVCVGPCAAGDGAEVAVFVGDDESRDACHKSSAAAVPTATAA